MKKRLPLVLFLVLAGVAIWLWRSRSDSSLAGAMTDFVVPDTARVDRIFIADQSGATIDLRRGPDRWTANGLPANPIPVNLLLKTFKRVEVQAPVPKAMVKNVLKMMASRAVKVEIYQGGKEPEKIWWVGHATSTHQGVFCVLEKPGVGRSDSPFVLGMSAFTGIINTRFHTKLDEWRSSDFAIYPDLTNIASVHVEHPAVDSAAYTLEQTSPGKFRLLNDAGNEVPVDTLIARDLFLHLRDAHFEYFERAINRTQRDSVMHSQPWHVLTVTGKDNKVRRMPFWKKNPLPGERDADFNLLTRDVDRMYGSVDDTALVVVQRYWFDRMIPYLSQVRAKAQPSRPPVPIPERKQ